MYACAVVSSAQVGLSRKSGVGSASTVARGGAPGRADGAAGDGTYTQATVDHLARAEALLTSFKGAGESTTDVALEGWARDLLADTRLLLDSPAAGDVQRRALVRDLQPDLRVDRTFGEAAHRFSSYSLRRLCCSIALR